MPGRVLLDRPRDQSLDRLLDRQQRALYPLRIHHSSPNRRSASVQRECSITRRFRGHHDKWLTHDRYDLENTFEVVVGKPAAPSKCFTIHTNVFAGRSGVLGKVGDSEAPVDLKAEDPELFQAYLNCVYFGSETIDQWADEFEPLETDAEEQVAADMLFEKLIRLYLLAERLIDLKTANLVIGEIIRFSDASIFIPTHIPVSLAYAATTTGSPLRKLSRDFWVYGSVNTNTERLRTDGFPSEFLQDIAIEMLRVAHDESARDFYSSIKNICSRNKCSYHQHDAMHPQCGSENLGEYIASKNCM